MSISLKNTAAPECIEAVMARMSKAPVHWVENVESDPTRFRTMCGNYSWSNSACSTLLNPDMVSQYPVTCRRCLEAMADVPLIVGAE